MDFVHHAGHSAAKYTPETMGSGVAVLDYNGDGMQDLYFVDSGAMPADDETPRPGGNRLYRNLGGFKFADVTEQAGVRGRGCGMGAIAADVDGDGDVDLLLTGYRSVVLYRNAGDGTFRDATDAAGVADSGWTTGAAFADFDGDGWLDLFLERYVKYSRALHRPCVAAGLPVYCTPDAFDAESNRLLRGLGGGRFADVSADWGVSGQPGKGLGVIVADLDDDGRPDAYCANDTTQNLLFYGVGGRRFEELGLLSGAGYGADGHVEAGMGVDAGDLDGDGRLDLVVTNFQREPNDVYRNEGSRSFTEVSEASGMAAASIPRLGFGVRLFDYDGDGLVDAAVANGHVFDNAERTDPGSTYAQPGLLMRGLPGGRFENVTATAGGDLARPRVGRGLATADLDDDGDLDLILTTNDGPAVLLENVGGNARPWVSVRLVGTHHDSTAIGARVTVEAGGKRQLQEVHSGGSYLSQSDLRLHFGLGGAERVDRIVVRWPDGTEEEARDLPARRHLKFVQGRGVE